MQKSYDKACLGLCQFRSLQGSGERQQGFASGWFPVQRIMQGRQGSPFATSTRMQGTRALALLYLHQIKGSKAGIHPQRRMEGFDYATPSFRSINATLSRPEITSYGCAMGHPHRLLTPPRQSCALSWEGCVVLNAWTLLVVYCSSPKA